MTSKTFWDIEGIAQTGRNRTINREKLDRAELERALADPASLRQQVFAAYRRLLRHVPPSLPSTPTVVNEWSC